jgi:hypothetical protein
LVSITAVVRALVDAGATPQMILAAVEAAERSAGDSLAARRANDAERQRRHRNVTSRDVTVTVCDSRDPLSETKVSPRPLSKTQPITDTSFAPKGAHGSKTILPFAKPNGFERFWEAYPRKVGKGDARRKYDRAVQALRQAGHDDPLAVLLAAIDRVKPTWDDAQFIPHAATWLHGGRWDDEPELPPPQAKRGPTIVDRLAAENAESRRLAFARMDAEHG